MAALMITSHTESYGRTTLLLAGRLTDSEIASLERAVGDTDAAITLDLGELRFANDLGIRTLCRLRREGVELANARQLIRLLLDAGC